MNNEHGESLSGKRKKETRIMRVLGVQARTKTFS